MKRWSLTLLFGLATLLTGCGSPKFTIVLQGGETIVPEMLTPRDAEDWNSHALSPAEAECDPVAKAVRAIGIEHVSTLLTKQESEHGLRYRIYLMDCCRLDREGNAVPYSKNKFMVINLSALALTNLSTEPITIEKILTETEEPFDGHGKLMTYAGRSVYCKPEAEGELTFFMQLSDTELTLEQIEGGTKEILKGVTPMNATLAPNETRIIYTLVGLVQSTSKADFQKALKMSYDYVQPLFATPAEGETK